MTKVAHRSSEFPDGAAAADDPRPRSASRRMDIELLRVLAVLAVMIFHFAPAGIQLVPNGYLGVDIFFTISGFVITAQMLRTRDRGEFTYPSFLVRRIRRLLPSAVLVLVVTMLVLLVFANEVLVDEQSRAGASAMLYVSNFYFAREAVDYFGANGQDSPFIHFWSLGVEEQFYVFWPIVFILIAVAIRRRAERFTSVLVGVTVVFGVVSVIGASIAVRDDFAYAFFMPWWRAHQLMLGALVAVWLHARRPEVASVPWAAARAREIGWLRIACVAWLVGICVQDWHSVSSPGWQGVLVSVPVAVILGTAWIVPKDRLVAMGSQSALAWIAAASYVLYLWHWPIWVAIRDSADGDANGYGLIALALLITFVLAALTHHFVEVPIHEGRWVRGLPNLAVIGVGVGTCVVLAVAMVQLAPSASVKAATAPSFQSALRPPLTELGNDQFPDALKGCFEYAGTKPFPTCTTGAVDGTRTAVLLGDSHAAQWMTPLGQASAGKGVRLITATRSNCPMLDVPQRPEASSPKECAAWRAKAYELVRKEKPEVVVVSGERPDIPDSAAATDEAKAALIDAASREMLDRLKRDAKRVVVVEDTPRLPSRPDTCLAGASSAAACEFPTDRDDPERRAVTDAMTGVARVGVVDPYVRVCPAARCIVVTPSSLVIYSDDTHLTDTYSRTLTPWVSGWLGTALRQAGDA